MMILTHRTRYCVYALLLLTTLVTVPGPLWSAESEQMLDLDLTELMQIQITSAGRKAQNLADVPAAVYVIDQEDIRNSGVTSIPEVLRMVPGLQVARISSSKWAITSRGFNGTFANKLLVQIDGRTVYTPSYSGVYWDVQHVMLEDVDRIEVIRGPGATLWGANAVNGVINVITKPASDTQGGLVTVAAGNKETAMASMRYGAQLNNDVYGRFYLSRHDQDAYKFAADGTDAQDDWHTTYGGFRLDGDVGLKDSWTFQGDAYRGEINQRVDTFWLLTSATPLQVQDTFNPEGLNFLGRWSHQSAEKKSWALQAYYDYYKRGDIYVQQKYHVFDLDFQHRFPLGSQQDIVWGGGYRLIVDEFGNTDQGELLPDSQRDSLFSVFVQDDISLIENKLWLTIGSKLEKNEYTGIEVQPSARLLWKPAAQHSIWSAVSRAVRTPSRVEDSGHILAQMRSTGLLPPFPTSVPLYLDGNSELDSEELIAYEAGYRYRANANFSLDVTFFYNDYDNLVNYQVIPGLLPRLQFDNGMEGETYGVEVSSEWRPRDWLTTAATYSYLDVEMSSNQADDINLRVLENSSPQHQISIRSGIDLGHDVLLNLWGRYIGEVKNASPQADMSSLQVDEYFAFDCNVIWQPREGLELMLVGQNLLDNQHLEFVSESFTSPIEIERSVYGKLNWKF